MTPYYDDGQAVIYHGDCREVLPSLPVADTLVTDPPYGLGDILHRPGVGEWDKLWMAGAPTWDRDAPADVIVPLVARSRFAIVWGGNYFALPPSRGWLIWDKIVREFSSGHAELAWTNLEQPVRAFSWSHGALASEGKEHPTQKPLALMQWCLSFVPDAAVILDPFMGSGTTLRAAKNAGIRSIGIEIEERYCEIAAKRLSQQTLGLSA